MADWIESKFYQKRVGSLLLKIIENSDGNCWIEIKFGESLVYKSPKPIDGGGEEAKKALQNWLKKNCAALIEEVGPEVMQDSLRKTE